VGGWQHVEDVSDHGEVATEARRPAGADAATVGARALWLQRSVGNAAVVRLLQRYAGDEELLKPAGAKGGSRKGRVDVPSCWVYEGPDEQSTVLAKLPEGLPVRVLSTDGEFWAIEFEDKQAYVRWMDVEISPRTTAVTIDQLFKVYPDLAKDAANDPGIREKADSYLAYMNEAFQLFGFDTLEAQAAFLAHGWAESDQFRRFTEATLAQTRYIEDPTTVQLDLQYLERQYPVGSENRSSINPYGPEKDKGDWRYLGRGATQVTHSYNYKRACDMMDLQASLLEKAGNDAAAARLREAAGAIRKDPREAARPRYTFLFSCAAGKMFNLDKPRQPVGKKIRNRSYNAGAVTGGHTDPQAAGKQAAFERALDYL
jgi:predicted chitinase